MKTATLIMNRAALDEILTNSNEYLNTRTRDNETWQDGFAALLQLVERLAGPIVEACEADYGDAGGPVMNRHALYDLVASCDGRYRDGQNTGNDSDLWLLGFSAGIQRLELFGGEIVADCT